MKIRNVIKTLFIIGLYLGTLLWAQKIDTLLTKQYFKPGDIVGLEMIEYNENAFLYLSYCEPYMGMISKIDKDYNVIWEKTIGDSVELGSSYIDMHKTSDNHFVLIGNESKSCVLSKFDTSATEIWKKTYGPISYNGYNTVKQTSDNGFLILSAARKTVDGDYDIWIIKTDEIGEITWQKTLGDSGYDVLHDFVELGDNKGYVCAGGWSIKPNYRKSCIIHFDINGNSLDTSFIDSSGEIHSISKITDTTFIFGGITNTYAFKGWRYGQVDIHGNVLWQKETPELGHPCVSTICRSYDNSFLLGGDMSIEGVGHFNTILQINEKGDSLGSYYFPTDHHGGIRNISQISQNRFVAAARMRHETTKDDLRFSILKLNYPPYFSVTSEEMSDSIHTLIKYSATIAALDSFPNEIVTYHLFAAPSTGLRIDSISGSISWQPQHADTGSYSVGVFARDRVGQTDSLSYTLTVIPNPNPILSKYPAEDSVTVAINSSVVFSLTPNPFFFLLDEVTYLWTKNNFLVGTGGSYLLYTDSSMLGETYKITCIVADTSFKDSTSWIVSVVDNVGIKEDNSIPCGNLAIRQYYQKTITITIPERQHLITHSQLRLYSLSGRKVLHLDLRDLRSGINRISIEPFNITSSLYIAELQVGKKRLKTKILLTQ